MRIYMGMFIGFSISNSNDLYILFFNCTNILPRFCAKQKIYTLFNFLHIGSPTLTPRPCD